MRKAALVRAIELLIAEGAIGVEHVAGLSRRDAPLDHFARFLVGLGVTPRPYSKGVLRNAMRDVLKTSDRVKPLSPFSVNYAALDHLRRDKRHRVVKNLLERSVEYLPDPCRTAELVGLVFEYSDSIEQACIAVGGSRYSLFDRSMLIHYYQLPYFLHDTARELIHEAAFDEIDKISSLIANSWLVTLCAEARALLSSQKLRADFESYASLASQQGDWIKPIHFDRAFFGRNNGLPLYQWRQVLAANGQIEQRQEKPGAFWYMRGRHAISPKCQRLALMEIMPTLDFRRSGTCQ